MGSPRHRPLPAGGARPPADGPELAFGDYRLDPREARLWRGEEIVPLGAKAMAVLQCLLQHPGRLVTKEALLEAAWPDTAVGDAVVTTAIREVRRALEDRAREPRFVATVHGRGYRFVAPVVEVAGLSAAARPDAARTELVGREAERERLRGALEAALGGRRRVLFVTGEAGIGKSALVADFAAGAAALGRARIGRGQCIEQFGAGEAYLPILEALARWGREQPGVVGAVLREQAPSWLTHLPGLASAAERAAVSAATPGLMLRELAEALERMCAREPLILVLEDLHWSDTATLEWLAYVARRRDPARLLVIGTYRPVAELAPGHPLRGLVGELRLDAQCEEIVLGPLGAAAVGAYVRSRCGGGPGREELTALLHGRTGGHPLFLSMIVDELRRRGSLEASGDAAPAAADLEAVGGMIPAGVREFIEHRCALLAPEERRTLEAASVAGESFPVAAAAAATTEPEEVVEARCARWAGEGRFVTVEDAATWPDGSFTARYRFRHSLFAEVIYGGISPELRARFHRRVAERLERAHAAATASIAPELGMHFERGREPRRALAYLERAARNALERSAYEESRRHLTRGLAVLERLPCGRARLESELGLSLLLGQVLMSTEGWASAGVGPLFARMRALCRELDDDARLPAVVWGQTAASLVHGDLLRTRALSQELLALAQGRRDVVFEVAARLELGGTALLLGELEPALGHFGHADALYEPAQHPRHVEHFGVDTGVFSLGWGAHARWLVGETEAAAALSAAALRRSEELAHPLTLAVTLAYRAMLHQLEHDVATLDRVADDAIAHCSRHGFPYYRAWAEILRGWSRAVSRGDETGIAQIERGLLALRETAALRLPYYLALLAEACGRHGRADRGLEALAEARSETERTGERWWLAELHRIEAELLRSRGRDREAEAGLEQAMAVAHAQGSPTLHRRAAVDLARLWRDGGRAREAERLLAEIAAGRP